MYRINEVKLGIGESKDTIPSKIKEKLKREDIEILKWKIVKESIDARKRTNIVLSYTVDFTCNQELNLPEAKTVIMNYAKAKVETPPEDGKRPVVVGFGPCGMFAALALSMMGLNPIIIERGKKAEDRSVDVAKFFNDGILNPESNVQYGEGGAGTFSDGKLTTGTKDPRIQTVLKELHLAGAPEEILYKAKPHIGTDILLDVVKNIREKIISLGGEIIFEARVTKLLLEDGDIKKVSGISYRKDDESHSLNARQIIFATGQSAVDSYELLERAGVSLAQKPFSMGFRVVHPQSVIDKAQYGDEKLAKVLGAAEYKLSHKASNGRGAYTFCMCPGGEVIMASSSEGEIVTNGMSGSKRNSPYANSALLVDVRTEDFGSDKPLAGIHFRKMYERKAFAVQNKEYKPVETTWKDFKKKGDPLKKCLPAFVIEAATEAMESFGKKIKGFSNDDVVFLGPETRSSSPVRVIRDENLQSNVSGIYPGGEGAGAAGGIMSAAVDGLRLAEMVKSKY